MNSLRFTNKDVSNKCKIPWICIKTRFFFNPSVYNNNKNITMDVKSRLIVQKFKKKKVSIKLYNIASIRICLNVPNHLHQ